jgi:hypothetical protein
MLVTDANKVILHLPRCGGLSVRWSLINAGYKYRFSCEHAPIKMLPAIYKNLPRIAFIRNPIDWYCSWYYYSKRQFINKKVGTTILMNVLSDNFNLSFDKFIINATDLNLFFRQKGNIDRLKKRIQYIVMNNYYCWQAFTWDDVESITANNFSGTFLNYKFNSLGLNTAKVYKIEDGIQSAIDNHFKNVIIQKRNCGKYHKSPSNNSIKIIKNTDSKYFNMFNY